MGRFVVIMVVLAASISMMGCAGRYVQRYEYRYRAGTQYEYKQLTDAYDPARGNPPPLPPLSDVPSEGTWVKVAVEEPVYVYEAYRPHREVVVVEDPWYHPHAFFGSSYYYSPRRHYRGSGVSVGLMFGSPYPPGYSRHAYPFGWYDPFCWP
jgi:hypothetical protein